MQAGERTRTSEEVEAEQQLRESRARQAQAKRMSADALGDEDDDLADEGLVGPDGLRMGGFKGRRERRRRAEVAPGSAPSGELDFGLSVASIGFPLRMGGFKGRMERRVC